MKHFIHYDSMGNIHSIHAINEVDLPNHPIPHGKHRMEVDASHHQLFLDPHAAMLYRVEVDKSTNEPIVVKKIEVELTVTKPDGSPLPIGSSGYPVVRGPSEDGEKAGEAFLVTHSAPVPLLLFEGGRPIPGDAGRVTKSVLLRASVNRRVLIRVVEPKYYAKMITLQVIPNG